MNRFELIVLNTGPYDNITYDIVWKNYEKEINNIYVGNKWNRIRGFNKEISDVAIIECEMDECRYILDELIPRIEYDYLYFKKLCEDSMLENSLRNIKPITSAYSKILDLKDTIQKSIEQCYLFESKFTEKQKAWYDFVKYGNHRFFQYIVHNLKYADGFENSDYYKEAAFIIEKFNIK